MQGVLPPCRRPSYVKTLIYPALSIAVLPTPPLTGNSCAHAVKPLAIPCPPRPRMAPENRLSHWHRS